MRAHLSPLWAVLLGLACSEPKAPPPVKAPPAPQTPATAIPSLELTEAPVDSGPGVTLFPDTPAPCPPPAPGVGGPDFAAVFAQVSPSVVAVVAGALIEARFVPSRSGSGFVWDRVNHVVTSEHLLGDAPEIRVRTGDGRVLKARILGRDTPTDLAMLEVPNLNLPPVQLADVSALKPGQWVAGIGNPFGLDQSITVGVVSALGRRQLPIGAPKYAEFIQTDLNMNPGNSGGPLVDGCGRTVGLNAAILDHGQGVSFAIPVDMVETVAVNLLAYGRFVRGLAGLYVRSVAPKVARDAGLPRPMGARVRALVKGGPAELAGLKVDDIVLTFGDQPVTDAGGLPWLIASTTPGTAVKLTLARGRARLETTLTVTAAPD